MFLVIGVCAHYRVLNGRTDVKKVSVTDVVNNMALRINALKGNFVILLLGDDEEDSGEGEHQLLELETPLSTPNPSLTGLCLALEFDGLLAEKGGVKTLRFEGTLYDIPITIMVDSGATHNFISSRLVSALGLPVLTFAGIAIKLGDGHSVFVSNRCVHIPIQLDETRLIKLGIDKGSALMLRSIYYALSQLSCQ
ncbi:hypothetical protein E3N88_18863 [Mikania micrantha]|uniref:Uncharacterized protein n=1 Tax=Mikania micrantha TaxID=192012 RepID=A0A5N6NPK3_9ASTR|nr:hypothetical protein E3N88_18863 [Mikania micrantha]